MTGSFTNHPVRVDTIGYINDRAKRATIVLPTGVTTLSDTTAEVRAAADDSVVWTCTVTGPMNDGTTGATVYIADFTP